MCPSRQSCPSVIPPTTCPSLSGLQSHPARWAVICQKCVKSVLGRQDPSLAGTFFSPSMMFLGKFLSLRVPCISSLIVRLGDTASLQNTFISARIVRVSLSDGRSVNIKIETCYVIRTCDSILSCLWWPEVDLHFLGAFHFDCWDRVSLYSLGWPELTMQTRVAADSEICRLNLWMARFKGMYHYTWLSILVF